MGRYVRLCRPVIKPQHIVVRARQGQRTQNIPGKHPGLVFALQTCAAAREEDLSRQRRGAVGTQRRADIY